MELTQKELRIHTLRGDIQQLMASGLTKYRIAERLEKRYLVGFGGLLIAPEFNKVLEEEYSKLPGQPPMPQSKPSIPLEVLTEIANEHCMVETLETQHSDSLDFHDISVWGLKAALEAAYLAGREAGAYGG